VEHDLAKGVDGDELDGVAAVFLRKHLNTMLISTK
jgi:hypothetical protein